MEVVCGRVLQEQGKRLCLPLVVEEKSETTNLRIAVMTWNVPLSLMGTPSLGVEPRAEEELAGDTTLRARDSDR